MAICSPARAPISLLFQVYHCLLESKKAIWLYHFWLFYLEAGSRWAKPVKSFQLAWSPLNPSGSGRTSPPGAETKISLKHVTVKSTWHSAWNFVRAQEMSLSSSQWPAALPQGISGAYPAVPPQIRPPGESPTARPSPQQSLSSVCSEDLMKLRLMMLVHTGLCAFQIAGTILCSWDVIACLPRACCETSAGTF